MVISLIFDLHVLRPLFYLRTLAKSPLSTANRYRFSSFVKGFGKLVMIKLFGLPMPGNSDGTAGSTCIEANLQLEN